MRVIRANLGSGLYKVRPIAEGMWSDDDGGRLLEAGMWRPCPVENPTEVPVESNSFTVTDFGDRDRVSWPTGACAVASGGRYSFSARYAFMFTTNALVVIDSERALVATVNVAGLFTDQRWSFELFRFHAGALWIVDWETVTVIDAAEMLALFDRTSGPIKIELRDTYPNRRRDHAHVVNVVGLARSNVTVRYDPYSVIEVPKYPGAKLGDTITLRDEITPGKYLTAELADGTGVPLRDKPLTSAVLLGDLVVEPTIDPAALVDHHDAPVRVADLDRLFATLADDPDPATCEILLDLLEDSGEPYVPALRELLAGRTDDPKRREALGPFASYLVHVGYPAHNLPTSGWLSAQAPHDVELGNAVAADHRLGLFTELHVGDGPPAIYAKLVGSPRAVGLREVDIPNGAVVAALIAAQRRDLVQLSNVKFATRAVIDGLGDPTFDRVVRLHTETTVAIAAKQLAFFIRDEAGFFARAPRHLILGERNGWHDQLLELLKQVLAKLPVAKVTVGDVTLTP